MKRMFSFSLLSVLLLVSCAPGTDLPGQVSTIVSNSLTQTAIPPTPFPTATSLPVIFASQIAYQNLDGGIQFSYPNGWYLQEMTSSQDIWGVTQPTPAIQLTSFDPSSPPHKLEWTDQTASIQFRMLPSTTVQFYNSLDAWVENARQTALGNQLSIFDEERLLIANQPAAHLNLVSSSGGIIHQVLTILNGRYFEINIEVPNFNLARTILDTIQPISSSELKPTDSDEPAAGICRNDLADPVTIVLGIDPSGLPIAGRCVFLDPTKRIKLINQANGPFAIKFAEYLINLPVGGEILLDKPVGQYLALGVHNLPMGPALWVMATPIQTNTPIPFPVVTMPPPIVMYSNSELGYKLSLPGDWIIDENRLSTNKEVIFSPPSAEPFIAYLSIYLEYRTLEQIIDAYSQNFPNMIGVNVDFHGYPGLKYTYPFGRSEYFVSFAGKILLIATDRPDDTVVQSILSSIQFTTSSRMFEVTIADNGKTINMNSGDGFMLNLSSDFYDWSVQVDNESVLGFEQGTGTSILGIFRARTPGIATLTASGNPKCINLTPPCLSPSIMFVIYTTVY